MVVGYYRNADVLTIEWGQGHTNVCVIRPWLKRIDLVIGARRASIANRTFGVRVKPDLQRAEPKVLSHNIQNDWVSIAVQTTGWSLRR